MPNFAPSSDVFGAASFSRDGRYRYALRRWWNDSAEGVLFIGLNPSTADARRDDPTIRRMGQFARRWGYGRMTVCNLFAYRATDPRELKLAADPVGRANDAVLRREAARAAAIVVCWGNHGTWRNRADRTIATLQRLSSSLFCLGWTRIGQPRHPLYLPGNVPPIPVDVARWRSVSAG